MATITDIQSVYDDQYTGYARGTDWTDDGDGTFSVVAGSALETAIANGRTAYSQRSSYSNTKPTGPFNWRVDGTASGLVKIATPSTAYASGTTVNIDQASLHISEALAGMQTRIRFQAWADDATAQGLNKGDFISLRLGISGSASASYEWRGVVEQRDPITATNGKRRFAYIIMDFGTLIRAADTSAVPLTAQAALVTLPNDAASPPQTLLGGVSIYRLSDLLDAVLPATLSYVLNAEDVLIERLPQRTDALGMIMGVLRSAGLYCWWDCADKACLVIEQHEHTLQTAGLVLTASQVFEVSRQIHQPSATPGPIERVVIKRPQDYGDSATSALPPDRSQSPQGATSRGLPIPNETQASAVAVTLYSVNETWTPQQEYTELPPGPVMFAFGDVHYKNNLYLAQQIHDLLTNESGQCEISPPINWTLDRVQGYNGLDWYFLVQPVYVNVRNANTYIDGYVVAREGYWSDTGAVNKLQRPIANAVVTLVGKATDTIYEVVTDSNGYYRVDNAVPDDYTPSVYVADDSYLANKHDEFTDPHPYDDDPYNDDLGPDNSVQLGDVYQLAETHVSFGVTYTPGQDDRSSTNDDYSAFMGYRGRGAFDYGDPTAQPFVLDDLSGIEQGIDTANVTNELQADQLSEQLIDQAEADGDVYVVTKPFGGALTRCGAVVHLSIATDVTVDADVRVLAREIEITSDGLPKEVISSSLDYFVPQIERQFARQDRVNTAQRVMQDRIRDLYKRIQDATGTLASADLSGVS